MAILTIINIFILFHLLLSFSYYSNISDSAILSVDKIIEIHHFMLNELYKIDPEFKKIPNTNELDPKLIALGKLTFFFSL